MESPMLGLRSFFPFFVNINSYKSCSLVSLIKTRFLFPCAQSVAGSCKVQLHNENSAHWLKTEGSHIVTGKYPSDAFRYWKQNLCVMLFSSGGDGNRYFAGDLPDSKSSAWLSWELYLFRFQEEADVCGLQQEKWLYHYISHNIWQTSLHQRTHLVLMLNSLKTAWTPPSLAWVSKVGFSRAPITEVCFRWKAIYGRWLQAIDEVTDQQVNSYSVLVKLLDLDVFRSPTLHKLSNDIEIRNQYQFGDMFLPTSVTQCF